MLFFIIFFLLLGDIFGLYDWNILFIGLEYFVERLLWLVVDFVIMDNMFCRINCVKVLGLVLVVIYFIIIYFCGNFLKMDFVIYFL